MALESPTHLTLGRNIGGVSKLFDTDSGSYPVKFRQTFADVSQRDAAKTPSSPLRSDLNKELCRMSSTFEEVLKTYNTEPITAEGLKAESRMDRIMDAFRRGESMLLSNDNLRPKSRCKTSLNELDVNQKSEGLSLDRPRSFNNMLKQKTFSQLSPDPISTQVPQEVNGLNLTNNAESTKKGRKYRKRAKSEGKSTSKKNKQGKPPIQSPAKYSSTPSIFSQSNGHVSRRTSSEQTSKTLNGSTVSYTMQGMGFDHRPKLQTLSINNTRSTIKDGTPAPLSIMKYKNSHNNSTSVTHYTHGNRPLSSPATENNLNENGMLFAQGLHVTVHKPELRVKSGHSSRSEEIGSKSPNSTKDDVVKDNMTVHSDQLLILNAKSCNVHRTQQAVSPSGSQRKHLHQVLSADMATRQASLEAIYGAMHNTANRITAHVEELKKVKKIFLSERQSGMLKESGMEYPCAPPATPTPDVLKKFEYVPSMADIRSQRAVKGRLQAMEKDAQKKKEKQKEAAAKLEKQQLKDREKILKAKQRKEIYALNKIMTDLEHKRFLEFCQSKGLNKT